MLLSIKLMLPERAHIGVSLMIAFAVKSFKQVRTQFPIFCFKSGWVDFEICFATPYEMSLIFTLVWTIALNELQSLNLTIKSSIILFLAVFALRNTRVHVCTINGHNVYSNVEAPIDQTLSILPTLCIPNIHPDEGHIRLR